MAGLLLVLLFILVLIVAAPLFGTDSRDGRDWAPRETAPDAQPSLRPGPPRPSPGAVALARLGRALRERYAAQVRLWERALDPGDDCR